MKRIVCTVVVLFTLAGPAWAGFDEGVSASERDAYATALRVLRPLAEQGDVGSQLNLAIMYAKGLGVAQDHAEAARWYRKAAEQGVAMAQYNLGNMYGGGDGAK